MGMDYWVKFGLGVVAGAAVVWLIMLLRRQRAQRLFERTQQYSHSSQFASTVVVPAGTLVGQGPAAMAPLPVDRSAPPIVVDAQAVVGAAAPAPRPAA